MLLEPIFVKPRVLARTLTTNRVPPLYLFTFQGPRKILTGSGNRKDSAATETEFENQVPPGFTEEDTEARKRSAGLVLWDHRRRGVGTSRESHLDPPSTSLCHNRRCGSNAQAPGRVLPFSSSPSPLLTVPGDLCTHRGTATSFPQLACPSPPSSAQTPEPGIHHRDLGCADAHGTQSLTDIGFHW